MVRGQKAEVRGQKSEGGELSVWIRLIIKAELLSKAKMANLLDECSQLCNILGRSVATAKEKMDKNQ